MYYFVSAVKHGNKGYRGSRGSMSVSHILDSAVVVDGFTWRWAISQVTFRLIEMDDVLFPPTGAILRQLLTFVAKPGLRLGSRIEREYSS